MDILTMMTTLILVIDDNKTESLIVSHLLGQYHVEVAQVFHLTEAMEFLSKRLPSVVLLDLNFDHIGEGFEFLKERTLRPWLSSIPVLIISSLGDLGAIERALLLGANGYLIKPYHPKKLIQQLKVIGVKLQKKTNLKGSSSDETK